jgi:23S rRNA (uracil1939-C5)-methyltransferase
MLVECPHADRCPGCPLITLPYAAQLSRKATALSRALGAYPALRSIRVPDTEHAEPISGYRVRAKFVAADGKLGLFARGSHEVVDIPECPVLRPRLREAAAGVRRLLPMAPSVSSVDLREADDGVLVTLAGRKSAGEVEALAARVFADVPGVVSVATGEREPDAPQIVAAGQARHGPGVLCHHLEADAPYHYAAHGAFTQLHAGQAAKLYAAIAAELGRVLGDFRGSRLLELYAGSGALALRLARAGGKLTLVESHVPAALLAERAAREQELDLTSMAGDSEARLRELAADRESFDAVLVNPPRRGLSPDVRRLLRALAPRAVVYVSCEPATFARDADDLARQGFRLESLRPFDLIPLSEAVETLGVLVAGRPPEPHLLYEDEALVAVSKSPHEPTTPQGEHEGSLLARVRALPGCAAAVPVHRLDLGTSGVCLFARTPASAAELGQALARGTKEYVALVRGIAREKGNVTRSLKDGRTEKSARTRYRREKVVGGHSLVRVFPEAGRTHQVRRHLAGIAHPLLGDERYGERSSNAHFFHAHGLDRSFLHLEQVTLERTEGALRIRDELAPDLLRVLESLAARS